ncbi:MAG: hypothetical protein LUM44_02210 [Pyrinomonadaceae bacterium]|nr:hypothetical protein [Pyrinomonadaceae bacterium]
MERKISSSLTEVNKVLSAVTFIAFLIVYAYILINYFSLPTAFFSLLLGAAYAFAVYEAWRMKDVEATDSGLIISKRLLFKQKHIFVPFENIESVKNKFLLFENTNQVRVRFHETTEFGKEVSFTSKDYKFFSESRLVKDLHQRAVESKNAEPIVLHF